jgi:hypothetical protein
VTREGGAFGGRRGAALGALAAVSLVAASFLGAFGDALYDPPSFSSDSFSRSALGHRAFVELLRGLGVQVVVSRHRTAEKAAQAVVALLEPRLGEGGGVREAILEEVSDASRRLLVVLPKRDGFPDPARTRFVGRAELASLEDAQRVLDALAIGARVVRPERAVTRWRGPLPAPTLSRPQLLASGSLSPLVESEDGVLVGELAEADGEGRTIVLADPDVLASHGLGLGDNAALAVALVERLGGGTLPLVVDETLHGLDQQPSLVRELLRFPLVLATASALVVAALLAWAAGVRFGRPRAPEPALAEGKLFLVESTAALLRHGGDAGHALAAYLRAAKDEVIHRLRPAGEGREPDAWLARAAEARGRDGRLRELEARVQRGARRAGGEEEVVRAAQDVHAWREEMIHGAHGDPRRDRAAQG